MYFSDFEYLHPFWRYSLSKFEVVQDCMFFTPKIILGRALQMLDQHYKTRPRYDHRPKFCANRPTHLGD